MAVHGKIMIDTRGGATLGYAVIVTKATDENGISLGGQNAYFAHNGIVFDGAFTDLAECC